MMRPGLSSSITHSKVYVCSLRLDERCELSSIIMLLLTSSFFDASSILGVGYKFLEFTSFASLKSWSTLVNPVLFLVNYYFYLRLERRFPSTLLIIISQIDCTYSALACGRGIKSSSF